jgi:hypothetical protein
MKKYWPRVVLPRILDTIAQNAAFSMHQSIAKRELTKNRLADFANSNCQAKVLFA